MPVAVFKGWMGIACLALLGLSNYIIEYLGPDALVKFNLHELGATLYLGAVLSFPLAGLSLKEWRATKKQSQSVFFIPVHFFVIILAILGYIFRDYVLPEAVPYDV